MSLIIVVLWPERSAALVRRRFRSYRIIDEVADLGNNLPADWIADSDELRVGVGSDLFFRTVTLGNLPNSMVADAARYAAEPLLPLAIDNLEISARPLGRRGRERRYLVSAIRSSHLTQILEAVGKLVQLDASGDESGKKQTLPVTWVGPVPAALEVSGSGLRSRYWAALAEDDEWSEVQCARTGTDAAEALTRRFSERDVAWEESELSGEQIAVARCRPMGSWRISPPRRRERLLRHWPGFLTAASLIFVCISYALQVAASEHRIGVSQNEIESSFTDALPRSRMVSPAEQIDAALASTKQRYAVILDRIGKKSSALEVMTIAEEIMREGLATIEDIRVSERQFVIVGSAPSVEVVQNMTKRFEEVTAPAAGNKPAVTAETRRTSRGLGTEFTIRGGRK